MIRAPGRATSRSDTLLLLACVLLSAVMIALPDQLSQRLAAGLRDTLLAPLLWVQRQAAEGRTSRRRFQAVQAERDSVALASQSLAALLAENARLRALLDLRARTTSSSVPAEVLHQTAPTEGRTLLLGVGARTGIRVGDPVVSPEGLLGVLVSVGARTAVAMTWAHPDFRVSAVTDDGSALGIVAPSANTDASEAFLEFRGVAYRDTVATGTLVMTSGLGGVYPKGVPIGRVAGVRREELGYERIYRLAPMANPGHVAHVLIVRTPAVPVTAP
jgi:rod shape-determining protein MreC